MLGRCRRRVLVCDSGSYRNAASHHVHGFLSRDCIDPAELLRIAREQLEPYGVELRRATVSKVDKREVDFMVSLDTGESIESRRVLIATGVTDRLPDIGNIKEFYGSSVHHCPYCDAWEHRDQALAVYGQGRPGVGLALSLKTWSADVVLCTDGPSGLKLKDRQDLAAQSIPLRTERIDRLEGQDGKLERIVFKKGPALERGAMFFNTGQDQACDLTTRLGCEFTKRGAVKTDKFERTCIPGLFAVGDCSRNVQFVAVAAAQGAIAAEAINVELQKEDRERGGWPPVTTA
jgi:thioredoxin reductase